MTRLPTAEGDMPDPSATVLVRPAGRGWQVAAVDSGREDVLRWLTASGLRDRRFRTRRGALLAVGKAAWRMPLPEAAAELIHAVVEEPAAEAVSARASDEVSRWGVGELEDDPARGLSRESASW